MGKLTIAGTDTVNAALLTKCVSNFTELYNMLTGAAASTLLTPTIASFAEANHDHTNDAGGGAKVGAAWTEYGMTSTIVGWASFTLKTIMYKKIGNIVFVNFYIDGISNATGATFTLPDACNATVVFNPLARLSDNSAVQTSPGLIQMSVTGTNVVTLYKTSGMGAWTNSGGKIAGGQFFYEIA